VIVADSDRSRYKDGTRSTRALMFLQGSYGTCRSDRCPLSSFVCNSLTPFHGGNTGSNPVGDAKLNQALTVSPFRPLLPAGYQGDTAGHPSPVSGEQKV